MKYKISVGQLNLLLILAGIALRLRHYLENQPLWLDEAWVGADITLKSVGQIFVNLTYFPDLAFTPILFQLMGKLFITLFGNSELSLRLFPCLSGIVSLFIFFLLLKKWGRGWVVPLALSLFALDSNLIFYVA